MHLTLNSFLIILLANFNFLQNPALKGTFDPKLITEQNEINFDITNKRGILSANGTVYFVPSSDESRVIAYRNNQVLWQVNAPSQCGSASVHQAIRYLNLNSKKEKLEVVYGKHSFLSIKLSTGQVTCEGSD